MGTYTKNGARTLKVENKKKVKKGIKDFYTRLGQINKLVEHLVTLDPKVTEENIDEIVPELIGRELDSMEKMIILAKLSNEETNNAEEYKTVSGGE